MCWGGCAKGVTLFLVHNNATRLVTHPHVRHNLASAEALPERQKGRPALHLRYFPPPEPAQCGLLTCESAPAASATRKRKRNNNSDTENDAPDPADAQAADGPESDEENDGEDEEEGFEAPKAKSASARKPRRKASPKPKATSSTKKPRAEKTAEPKPHKVPARRGRKPKEGENPYDAEQVAKDTKISADNPLFSEFPAVSMPLSGF